MSDAPPDDMPATAVAEARIARQSTIATDRNPLPRADYLARFDGTAQGNAYAVTLRYVPDKRVLPSGALQTYLDALPTAGSPESLAAMILDDMNNELVPRFIQVRVGVTNPKTPHAVLMEDRRPRWDNPPLLARLSTV